MTLLPDQEFGRCAQIVLQAEGSGTYTNDPRDRGGPTKFGVTLKALSAYRGAPCVAGDVQALTEDEALALYRRDYWHPIAGDQLPAGVNLVAFDCAVNQGPGHAARWLQAAAGVPADGQVGPLTIAAVEAADPIALIELFRDERLRAYEQDAGWATYGHGWTNRDDAVAATATQWAKAG